MVSRLWRQHETVRQGRRELQYAGILGRPRTPNGGLVLRQRRTVYWRKGHLCDLAPAREEEHRDRDDGEHRQQEEGDRRALAERAALHARLKGPRGDHLRRVERA